MKNFVQDGVIVTLTAPYVVTSGQGALIGALFGVATKDIANAALGDFRIHGVFDLDKDTAAGSAVTEGGKVYWENTLKKVTGAATANTLIGTAMAAAADGAATARVRVDGVTR